MHTLSTVLGSLALVALCGGVAAAETTDVSGTYELSGKLGLNGPKGTTRLSLTRTAPDTYQVTHVYTIGKGRSHLVGTGKASSPEGSDSVVLKVTFPTEKGARGHLAAALGEEAEAKKSPGGTYWIRPKRIDGMINIPVGRGELKQILEAGKVSKEGLFPVDVRGKDLDGKPVSTQALKGKVVILDFWATYCVPCLKAMPHLAALQTQFAGKLQVVGLAHEAAENKARVKELTERFKVNYPNVLIDDEVGKQFPGFGAFPMLVILDKQGRVRFTAQGSVDHDALEALLKGLINEPAPRAATTTVRASSPTR